MIDQLSFGIAVIGSIALGFGPGYAVGRILEMRCSHHEIYELRKKVAKYQALERLRWTGSKEAQ